LLFRNEVTNRLVGFAAFGFSLSGELVDDLSGVPTLFVKDLHVVESSRNKVCLTPNTFISGDDARRGHSFNHIRFCQSLLVFTYQTLTHYSFFSSPHQGLGKWVIMLFELMAKKTHMRALTVRSATHDILRHFMLCLSAYINLTIIVQCNTTGAARQVKRRRTPLFRNEGERHGRYVMRDATLYGDVRAFR
jgi:hypothetical protein